MKYSLTIVLLFLSGLHSLCMSDEPDAPRPTPLTRPLLKEWLENVKQRVPRIPLPELSEQDRQLLGSQVDSYESRVRHHYLNGIEVARPIAVSSPTPNTRSRDQDPNYSLDNAFKIELFWIVSRVNNCQYCIGHQESKLLGAGKTEDEIATLDGDWSDQPPKKRIAFQFARKLTYEPQKLNDEDINQLRTHYTDLQILEMIISMCGNNSINRWKEAIAVPQRADEGGYSRMASLGGEVDAKLPRGSYLTPTSSNFQSRRSSIVPASLETTADGLGITTANCAKLESPETVLAMLDHARVRATRLPVVDVEKTRTLLPLASQFGKAIPNWVRLLANFPTAGTSRLDGYLAAESGGDLTPTVKGQIAWIVARQDRAWYAVGHAMTRLKSLGLSEQEVFQLDGDWNEYSNQERALFSLARNLATSPVTLTSQQVAEAVKHAGPRDTVQAISYICSRASFNRLTEAAGLTLEESR
jgi:alkylhydroperoxidase family enzyme